MKPAEEWTEADFPRCDDGLLTYWPQGMRDGDHPSQYAKDGIVPYYCTDGEAFIYPSFTLLYLEETPRERMGAHLRTMLSAWKRANPRLKERP